MHIDYHDLSDKDFEQLVIAICAEILGTGVAPFCSGPDGSRDGRFEGTAADLPNPIDPYKGKFIIQSKHTENPVGKFSDAEFSSEAASSVLSTEIPGVKRLVASKELDHYLLFSNRRMSGLIEGPITARIVKETGAATVQLFGIERIDMLLKRHPRALQTFGKQPLHLPLLVTCDDLAEVILAISSQVGSFEKAFVPEELERVAFQTKNEDNGLSADLAAYIRKEYVPQFEDLKKFLANPDNEEILSRYLAAAEELKEQIALHRKDYKLFDDVLVRITTLLFYRDGDLARKKALTKLVIYYMYWICDIGSEVQHVATE